MNLTEKEKWILDYIENKENLKHVDMLHAEFVEEYAEKFNVKTQFVGLGALKCEQLSRLLGNMYRKGILERFTMPVNNILWTDGFPRWIYCYKSRE